MRAKHLRIERKADAYAHQLSATMEHLERAWHEKRGLAAFCRFNYKHDCHMGKGKHISMETLLRICGALDCDIADVIKLIKEDEILE